MTGRERLNAIVHRRVHILSPLEQIGPALNRIYTPRLRRANFCLCAFADGISAPLERFLAVKEWMEQNGNT